MKTTIVTLLLLLPSGMCFVPPAKATLTVTRSSRLFQNNKKVEAIDHELQELGAEIKPHVIGHEAHGFGAKESVVHKLRHELREKNKLYNDMLDEMERIERRQVGMMDVKTVLEKTLVELQQQNAMIRHKKEISQQQQDTIHDLLQTIKKLHDDMVQSSAFAMAWETAEVELWREKRQHAKWDKERESLRSLLWQVTKLTGRRLKNLVKRILFLKK